MTATPFAGKGVPDRWDLQNPDAPVELGWDRSLRIETPEHQPAPQRREPQQLQPVTVQAEEPHAGAGWTFARRWGRPMAGVVVAGSVLLGSWWLVDWYATSF